MFFFNHKTKTKAVPFGKQFTKECPKCHQQARFVECELTEDFTAYGVVKLYEDQKRVMRCDQCDHVFKMDEVTDPKTDEAQRKQKAEQEAHQKAKEAQEEQERQERKKEKDAAVDKELEELKRQLGQ